MSVDDDKRHDRRSSPSIHVQAINIAISAIGGITINLVSGDVGYRWAAVLWVLVVALGSAWWLRRLAPRAPLVRWFGRVCLGGALLAAVSSVAAPASWALYAVVVAAILATAVMVSAAVGSPRRCCPGCSSSAVAWLSPVLG